MQCLKDKNACNNYLIRATSPIIPASDLVFSLLLLWELTGWISLQSKGLSRVFSSTTVQKHPFFGIQPFLWCNSHPYMTTGKTIALTIQTFVCKVLPLLFKILCLYFAFLSKSKCLLISWLQSSSTVILDPPKIKSLIASIFFPFYLPWSDGTRCHDLSFLNVEL